MTPAWIMMYHRICPLRAETRCYHERGTAVTPARFAAQVAWMAERFEMITLADLSRAERSGRRPYRILTFDDGYRDVLEHAVPVCERYGIPISVFPVAEPVAGGEAVWVDRYYDILHRARRRGDVQARELGVERWPGPVPGLDGDARWWVRGPLKEHLHALAPASRVERLRELADILESDWRPSLCADLYMTREQLATLVAGGHEIGGHGFSHSRLTELDDSALAHELDRSRALLDELGMTGPLAFCYPDGRHDQRVRWAAANAGFSLACTVESGPVTTASDPMAMPRWLIRDTVPEELPHG